MYLRNFKVLRPRYEESQQTLLEWIVQAHMATRARLSDREEDQEQAFKDELKETLLKVGLGANKIQKRGFEIPDCHHENWKEMQIYNIDVSPEGHPLEKRMEFFNKTASEVFERMYKEDEPLPPHLVHVTCTGYVAPSPAQQLVSNRVGGRNTTVTHAYHMGCYGAIPAIRMGMGHYSVENEPTDIVHTELCSLHMNPTFHTTEQLVVQSLFADGFIRYCVGDKGSSLAFKILAVEEEVLDNSLGSMTWDCHNWGFQMSLSKEIPVLIRRNLPKYLERLAKKGGKVDLTQAHYAIHPGGPKIIDQIAAKLKLDESQISHSRAILQNCGNMSSATIPHIWERILNDPHIEEGTLVVGLAFGPGLSICGILLEKVG